MCGIAGVFDIREHREITPELIERTNNARLHRGPDDGGVHVEPRVGLKFNRGEGKYLFKRALRSHRSEDVLYRRKMVFGARLAHWFRGPLAALVRCELLGLGLLYSIIFDPDTVRSLVDQYQQGHWDHSVPPWSRFIYFGFQKRFPENARASEESVSRASRNWAAQSG